MSENGEKSKIIVLEQQLVKSRVWIELGGVSKTIFLIFRCKCQYQKPQGHKHRRQRAEHVNNGELVFTYAEALKKYGITAPRFRRAIDELLAKGLIDIASTGAGMFRMVTLFAISERWRFYGTSDFVEAKRPKRNVGYPGFKRGNKLWQKTCKKKLTDDFVHGAMHDFVHGELLAMHTNVHGEKVKILYKRRGDKWLSFKIA